jgi:putative transposase
MPLPKKKRTTSNIDPAAMEEASSPFPEPQTFHEHLRALTRDAVRLVIEKGTFKRRSSIATVAMNLR